MYAEMNALTNEEFQIKYCEKLNEIVNTNFWDERFDQTTEDKRESCVDIFLRADEEEEENELLSTLTTYIVRSRADDQEINEHWKQRTVERTNVD